MILWLIFSFVSTTSTFSFISFVTIPLIVIYLIRSSIFVLIKVGFFSFFGRYYTFFGLRIVIASASATSGSRFLWYIMSLIRFLPMISTITWSSSIGFIIGFFGNDSSRCRRFNRNATNFVGNFGNFGCWLCCLLLVVPFRTISTTL